MSIKIRSFFMIAFVIALAALSFSPVAHAKSWQAGVAKTNITPDKFLWMSGYGSRNKPAEGSGDARAHGDAEELIQTIIKAAMED